MIVFVMQVYRLTLISILIVCLSSHSAWAQQSMLDFQKNNSAVQYNGAFEGEPWISLPPYGEDKLRGSSVESLLSTKKSSKSALQKEMILQPNRVLAMAKISLYTSWEFQKLESKDQENLSILINGLNSIPQKCIKPKEIAVRILSAYKENLELHREMKMLSGEKDYADFHKLVDKARLKESKRLKCFDRTLLGLTINRMVKRYSECQLELHYFCSSASILRVESRLGINPVRKRYLRSPSIFPFGTR